MEFCFRYFIYLRLFISYIYPTMYYLFDMFNIFIILYILHAACLTLRKLV